MVYGQPPNGARVNLETGWPPEIPRWDGIGKETSALQNSFTTPESLLAYFFSEDKPGKLLILTGEKGSGKSSFCTRLALAAQQRGFVVDGLVTIGVIENGDKKALKLVNLRTKEERFLATSSTKQINPLATENWQFDSLAFQWGNEALKHNPKGHILILDEFGPLELERGVGLTAGIEIVSSRSYPLSIIVVRPSLLENARSRWPWAAILSLPQGAFFEEAK